MVTTAPAATAQANDNEKKRKQTLERAKANHLSRQLQMRLQYARLKVDHGWQKQNLNEVENLYFHHSHLRGPRPYPTSSLITTTQCEPTSFSAASPNPPQSNLSFRLGSSSLSRTPTNPNPHGSPNNADSAAQNTNAEASSSSLRPNSGASHPSSFTVIDPSLSTQHTNLLVTMDVDLEDKHPPNDPSFATVVASSNASLHPHLELRQPEHQVPRHSKSPIATHTPLVSASSWASSSASMTNHYNNVQSAPANQQHPTASSSTPTPDPYGFAASSSLTYASFWSSHSASTVSRPFRGSAGSVIADLPSRTSFDANTAATSELGAETGSSTNFSGERLPPEIAAKPNGGRRRNAVKGPAGGRTSARRSTARREG